MRTLLASALLATAAASPAAAQTSRCYWVGSIWTCDQAQPAQQPNGSGIDWSIARQDSFSDSLRQGLEMGESIRQSRQSKAERERAEAEADLYRAQAEAIRSRGQQPPAPTPQPLAEPDYLTKWMAVAKPRMGLYPDFEEKVFAPEVNITRGMVVLMTTSDYAADIAYYLATHKAEALAISTMPLLEAARAIDSIEADLKASAPAGD